MKPTWGLVPYTGGICIDPCLDHAGTMARTVADCALLLEVNLSETATLKKTKYWFSRPIIAKCRSKLLQYAPLGAFCNTFDLHYIATVCHKVFVLSILSGRFTQVLLKGVKNVCSAIKLFSYYLSNNVLNDINVTAFLLSRHT